MDATWIVTANAGRARFFSRGNATATLEEINDMVNTDARLRTIETETDQIGQLSASKSRHGAAAPTQPSGYEPDQSPAGHQAELFARSVADYLLQGQLEGRFGQLIVAASPQFLGVLRKLLDPRVVAAVDFEINKDYTQLNAKQLGEQIAASEP